VVDNPMHCGSPAQLSELNRIMTPSGTQPATVWPRTKRVASDAWRLHRTHAKRVATKCLRFDEAALRYLGEKPGRKLARAEHHRKRLSERTKPVITWQAATKQEIAVAKWLYRVRGV